MIVYLFVRSPVNQSLFLVCDCSKGTIGFEQVTSRSAVECFTTELYPLDTNGLLNIAFHTDLLLIFSMNPILFNS